MKIVTEAIESAAQEKAAEWIRREVFEHEWKCKVANPVTPDVKKVLHLLARLHPCGDPIATLSVVETTGNTILHSNFEISVGENATIARYTQLAVLKPYRGLHVDATLVQEALLQCASEHKFDYTWLLFNAARAQSSSLCRFLGFEASDKIFQSEFGSMRVLLRKESNCDIPRGRTPTHDYFPAFRETPSDRGVYTKII